jgi:hypothetical protein
MLSSNPKLTSSQIINPAFRNHPLRQPLVNPGHLHIPCPPLSVVKFLKNNSTSTLQLVRFVEDSHYASFCKHGQAFLPNIFTPGEKTYLSVTRANRRLPTCATTVAPLAIVSALSLTFSPSSLTPP